MLLSGALLSVFATSGDQARFTNLGHQMICMCGCNQILLECNHVGCTYSDKMRDQLMAGLQKGSSDTQIQQSFVQEYGLTVLAAPLNSGFGRVAWITPFAVFITGILVAALVIRNWKLRPAPAESPSRTTASGAMTNYREQARKETEF